MADVLSVKRVREDLDKATELREAGDLRGAALAEVVSHQRGEEYVVTYVRPFHPCPCWNKDVDAEFYEE